MWSYFSRAVNVRRKVMASAWRQAAAPPARGARPAQRSDVEGAGPQIGARDLSLDVALEDRLASVDASFHESAPFRRTRTALQDAR